MKPNDKPRRHCEACGVGMDSGRYCQKCRDDGKAWQHFQSLEVGIPVIVRSPTGRPLPKGTK